MNNKKKKIPGVYFLQDTQFIFKDMDTWKVNQKNKVSHANRTPKKTGEGILISDNIDFNIFKKQKRDKEALYIVVNASVLQKEITIPNIYEHNVGEANM